MKRLLTRISDEHEPLLEQRLSTHAFTASEHLQAAIGFVPPNFLCHFFMVFTIFRQGGAKIGKADFDEPHRNAADLHIRPDLRTSASPVPY
ncbi:DUF1993 family protein [Granulosicoccus sp. 3-233]|uniref:DUF1993 family protein n=1 Tax=Granulosicoccus sp. 3-233 TaxID=3417969 RepID=UPI003D34733A